MRDGSWTMSCLSPIRRGQEACMLRMSKPEASYHLIFLPVVQGGGGAAHGHWVQGQEMAELETEAKV